MQTGEDTASSGRAEKPTERFAEWFLLDGHRYNVAGVTAFTLFTAMTIVVVSGITPLRSAQPLYYLFGGLITGNLTVITVVVSINQLLLSRELGTPSEFRSEIEGVEEYRRDVEEAADRLAPVEPQGFLRQLYETMRREAQQLGGLTVSTADEEVYDEIDQVVSTLTGRADRVDELLKTSSASTFTVLSATLTTNYAKELHHLRGIRSRFEDRLTEDAAESIEALVQHLRNIDVARQYFKTIYLQEELTVLSRRLFFVGIPSVAIVAVGLFIFTSSSGASLPRPYLGLVIPAITTVGLVPLILLFAYVLRLATVTRRTVATLPFTTPSQER